MTFYKNKKTVLLLGLIITSCNILFCSIKELTVVGGGIVGAMEAYYAFVDAKKNNTPLKVTIYEKNNSIAETTTSNIVPSLTCDEILSVVPRGQQLVEKLNILFSKPGGIRVDDVHGVNDSVTTQLFLNEVQTYSLDEVGHKQRTQDLLALGKMSMDLWKELYNSADDELKEILHQSNFNPCCEPLNGDKKVLADGYRIDLIYNVPNAQERALAMKFDYEALGYKHCSLLTPNEVMAIDPFLTDFCKKHSADNMWHDDAIALWRPGGCIDTKVFLPKLYEYLKKQMGTHTDMYGKKQDCFNVVFGKKVVALEHAHDSSKEIVINGLKFENDETVCNKSKQGEYVFCPGEAVGTLKKLGLNEPAYAGFAGVSLLLDIAVPLHKQKEYAPFRHCMEVHQEGVVLAWQARFRDSKIFIGVAGTKAFYSDQQPTKDQAFAKNRNLLQLNMVNDVLPEFISLALGYDTKGKLLTENDLNYLESQKIATRWAGTRSVVYDGFPTVGHAYKEGVKIQNARCTTHLGSGGGSFSPAAVVMSRRASAKESDEFTQRILHYGNSLRSSK